ncbi:pyrroloquinoline quinone biosynthesis protein PqqB [Granulicella sp. WH15]|uniref:pyrroloquinoline quinone biosynthesis protein PqqB n=1 Tax=Granulicella sp. WH15 TaxID=2602070 RepID=UPI0013674671|nr:pyrroloquinoline quinone biosynthesis protein PqqB [Granulicella sp. WH15]QHN03235.1 pyrroloquinoline quinone biosynthesis protein PqqB [Granulicella sp. WH15]
MRLHLLGAAAGGGLPQWNCACSNCQASRSHPTLARSQSQLAVSADGNDWLLVNASPDLRDQLSRTSFLHPKPQYGLRHTPVAGVLLTSADLDHILGLLLMREFTPVSIYATDSVLSVLESNPFFSMLERVPGQKRTQTIRHDVPLLPLPGLKIIPIELPGSFPMHIPTAMRDRLKLNEMTLGVLFESSEGRRAAYLPALPSMTPELLDLLSNCNVVMVDGTLWSEDELQRLQPGTPSATEMGHMPIGGPYGSLTALRGLTHVRRIYTHINNSNPILANGSEEQKAVLNAGIEIGYDGMEINL